MVRGKGRMTLRASRFALLIAVSRRNSSGVSDTTAQHDRARARCWQKIERALAGVIEDDLARWQNDADKRFGFRIDCPLSPQFLYHRAVGDRGVAGAGRLGCRGSGYQTRSPSRIANAMSTHLLKTQSMWRARRGYAPHVWPAGPLALSRATQIQSDFDSPRR
jgi:hypothetical protein